MKPIITLCDVHDASLCVYDIENDNIIIVDLEKVTRTKHFAFHRKILKEKQVAITRRALNYLELSYGIKNDFSHFIFKAGSESKLPLDVINAEHYHDVKNKAIHGDNSWHHHKNHVLSTYAQSPFNKCFAISWDGIGDDTSFYTCKVNEAITSEEKKWVYDFSRVYNFSGRRLKLLEDTRSWMDVAGKLMGLSSYGYHQETSNHIIETMQKAAMYKLSQEELDAEPEGVKKRRISGTDMTTGTGTLTYATNHIHKYLDTVYPENTVEDLESQYHYAYCAQKMIERSIIELIQEKYYDDIVACDNNLVITGGVGLNVLANQLIRKTFPEFNLFVSSSSSDSGQSFGLMYNFLIRENLIDPSKKFDTSYGGTKVFDDWIFDRLKTMNPNVQPITAKEVAELITDGKIVGIIQGRHEIGPRALGNRSIICDPSFPEMKDHLNSKVKFREWYRPFAPICRKENAHKFFDSPTFEGYELMNYVADIKPEFADAFPSIVHVDGTCRLQTIEEKKNKFIYDILGYTDGVLLNTSLNVKGQPILNHLSDAIDMLQKSGLDCFIYENKGEFYYFDDMVLSE
jgi:carbamoyltransferase